MSFFKSVLHRNRRPHQQQQPVMDLCEICHQKPKFIERGYKHPYCSRTCARYQGSNPIVCVLSGCRATGKSAYSNFCSVEHAMEGVRIGQVVGCSHCNVNPRVVGEFCLTCDRKPRAGPRLRELKPDSTTFKTCRSQFLSEWKTRNGDSPSVEKVYEVVSSSDAGLGHDTYGGQSAESEAIRTFHSSQCICDLGFKDVNLCSFQSCGICCIVKSSFKSFAFGEPSLNGRFGDGIYSYRNPALADNYATSCTSSPYRVMLACDTIVERGQVPGSTSSINEESIFSLVAEAILPVYVIMYTCKRA